MKRIRMIALAGALICLGNLGYGSTTLSAQPEGCAKGCSTQSQCGTSCVCFPNPFDEFPEPGQCTY